MAAMADPEAEMLAAAAVETQAAAAARRGRVAAVAAWPVPDPMPGAETVGQVAGPMGRCGAV